MTRIKAWLIAAGSLIAAFSGAVFWGWLGWKKAQRAEAVAKELKNYADTRKRMDEADIVGDDPAAARVFLAERGKRDRDL
jgi:hypothetical protein